MRALVFAIALVPTILLAQRRGPAPTPPYLRSPAPSAPVSPGTPLPPAGALGGSFLSPGFSRPLGGITPSRTPVIRNTMGGRRYVGPVFYVPNAFETYNADVYASQAAASAAHAASPGAPVIVNQYFNTREDDYARTEFNSAASRAAAPASVAAGDPIGPAENYYLIAYKDHSVYSALAYWVEDSTLHYVTTQNTHNQASLSLIDVDRTTKLNSDRNVPFALAR